MTRADGAMVAHSVPAGFLKVTRNGIRKIMKAHPELLMGRREAPAVDLFHHGAHDFIWYGEDMAFCRRWREMGETIWLLPDLDLDHHDGETVFPGNFHRFMLRQPGGSEDPSRWRKVLDVEPQGVKDPAYEPAGFFCSQCRETKPYNRNINARSNTMLGIWICDDCYYGPAKVPRRPDDWQAAGVALSAA